MRRSRLSVHVASLLLAIGTALTGAATAQAADTAAAGGYVALVTEFEDHVIVFLVNRRLIPKVEKLFQVGVGYL